MTAPPLVFLDTETDRLAPDRKAWEVALIRRETHPDGQIVEREWHAFLGVSLHEADPFALNVGGYWDRHPRGRNLAGRSDSGPADMVPVTPPHEAALQVMRWTFGATLVGVVPEFDAHTLGRLLRSQGLLPMWHHHPVDLVSMSLGWIEANPGHRVSWDAQTRSDDLAALCGVPAPSKEARHTAMGDARWARDWYDVLTGRRREAEAAA